jgi:hypothetical protein
MVRTRPQPPLTTISSGGTGSERVKGNLTAAKSNFRYIPGKRTQLGHRAMSETRTKANGAPRVLNEGENINVIKSLASSN